MIIRHSPKEKKKQLNGGIYSTPRTSARIRVWVEMCVRMFARGCEIWDPYVCTERVDRLEGETSTPLMTNSLWQLLSSFLFCLFSPSISHTGTLMHALSLPSPPWLSFSPSEPTNLAAGPKSALPTVARPSHWASKNSQNLLCASIQVCLNLNSVSASVFYIIFCKSISSQ